MEFIDIYNENHKYLGVCEKGLAHKLGLWHEVFNGIIVNKENKSIIFQIKVTLKNFIEAYLKGDELYLRLAIASKRFIEGERIELLRW